MGRIARRTANFIGRTVGKVNGVPRIRNLDRGPLDLNGVPTGLDMVGYVDINENATTPFSRGKVHKGYFCCKKSEMMDGDLVYDRSDSSYYFVMSAKDMPYNNETVYVDGTMYACSKVVEIQRFEDSARDTFGRPTQNAPRVVSTGIRAMFNPENFDTSEQQDRLIVHSKIKMCVQSKVGLAVADRIVTASGTKYRVSSIDEESLVNLIWCILDLDAR